MDFRLEYPRPNFTRENWKSLNGVWTIEIDGKKEKDFYLKKKKFSKDINVPYVVECEMSGVNHKDFMDSVWYTRDFEVEEKELIGRVLLNFEAVSNYCEVYVNGTKIGSHKGGYTPFTLDATKAIKVGINNLKLYVVNDVKDTTIPTGKQSRRQNPYSCLYYRSTGIWQSVWVEFVDFSYLDEKIKITNDLEGNLKVVGKVDSIENSFKVKAEVLFDGKVVAEDTQEFAKKYKFNFKIENPKLWTVDTPNLYDIKLYLYNEDTLIDEVTTYTGFRTVELVGKKVLFNGKEFFQRLVLDQGYYKDSSYTAPSKEALKRDITISKEYGFNGARLHQKIFERRFLYYADKIGYVVWGEMPDWGFSLKTEEGLKRFKREFKEMVTRDFNHPSIIGWCPLNERWAFVQKYHALNSRKLYDYVKELDTSRLITLISGGFHFIGTTDFWDYHDYNHNPEKMMANVRKFYKAPPCTKFKNIFRSKKTKIAMPKDLKDLPIFVSEFGGLTYKNSDGNWGYNTAFKNDDEFLAVANALFKALQDEEDMIGYCYTQLTDVYQEQNGIVAFDRSHKLSKESIEKFRKQNSMR